MSVLHGFYIISVDVALLGKGALKFFDSLHTEIGVSPVDVARYTVASYSFNAVQMELFKKKKWALYSPDFQPLYHAIRQSCLGGLSMVTRHDCTPGSLPINSHRGGENPGKCLHYYDENSLYASAVSGTLFQRKAR